MKATNAIFGILTIILALAVRVQAQTYFIADLGTLGGNSSALSAINNSGVAVGYSYNAEGNYHAVLFSNGVVDLGTLGGLNSSANGINLSSQIVGFANVAGSAAQQAFSYNQTNMTNLNGLIAAGSTNSIANAVNSAGAVVGVYWTASGNQRPFVYTNGVVVDLGFGGSANCINDGGQIGGFENNNGHLGFIISNGQENYVGTLGGNDTSVSGINNNGVAVGNSLTVQGTYHAFKYESGTLQDLGTLGGTSSSAYGINSCGQTVGQATDLQGVERAYVYKSGPMLDLNNCLPIGSGWFLSIAYGINDAGQIVGAGQINGQTHGFLLTPNPLALTVTNPVLALNGTSAYVAIPSSSSLQPASNITVEAWIFPAPNAQNNSGFIIKSDGASVNSQRTYELFYSSNNTAWPSNNTLYFGLFLNTSTWADVFAVVPSNQWVHVAATYASSNGLLQLYTNGVLAASTNYDASGTIPLAGQTVRQTTQPLYFGVNLTVDQNYGYDTFASGYMDEIRIWSKARSQQEIYGTMFCRLTGAETNLEGYWNFDDGTANDLTSNANNGTFIGGAEAVPIVASDAVHAGVCGCSPPPSFITNGLVAYYPFNGTANDASGNGNNGLIIGTDWQYSPDRFGKAESSLFLNTSDPPNTNVGTYVVVPRSSNFDFNQNFTLSVWINITNGLPPYHVHNLMGNGPDSTSANFRIISAADTNGDDYLQFVSNQPGGEGADIHAFLAPLRNTWWQAVVVRCGTNVSLYSNGALVTNSGISASLLNLPEIWLGSMPLSTNETPSSGEYPLDGGIDDVRMYDRALSLNEVQQLYSYESTPPQCFLTNGLLAYYPFNGNANDASGNGNNGTNYGAILATDRFGNPNSCYLFDGVSQKILAGIPNIPTNAHDRTLSIWEKFTGNLNNAGTFIPAAWGANADDGAFGIMAQYGTPPIQWWVQFWGGGQDVGSGVSIDNNWHQIVAVYGNGEAQLFIDGVLEVSGAKTPDTGFSSLCIGAGVETLVGGTTYFPGYVDDVRVYNRALSTNEVAQLYAIESTPPVSITTQPQSTTNNIGDTVTFTVASTNGPPLTFQWYFNNNPINSATNSSLTLSNVQQVNVGDYYAVVSDSGGGVASSVATLNIVGIPSWINDGLAAYYPFNGNANDASGNGNNGTDYGGILIPDRFGNPNAAYFLNGTNAYIIVSNAPANNLPAQFTISFWMNPNPGYGTPASSPPNNDCQIISKWGAGGAGLASYNIGVKSTGQLYVATSDGVSTTEAVDTTITTTGVWHQVIIVRDGNGFHLYRDNQMLVSANSLVQPQPNSVYNLNFGREEHMNYAYYGGGLDEIRIYNLALSSNEVQQLYAYESGTNPPSIGLQPQPVTVNAYGTASFSATAYGSPTLNYQWSFNSINLLGATNSSLTISNVAQCNLGAYAVVVTNAFGSTTSSNTTLSMYPFLIAPFAGVVTDWGYTNTLSIQAWGTGPLSYQWFDNGVAIQNATNSTLTFTSIQFTNAGLYSVVVSNSFGSVTNTPEQVVVNPAGVSLGLYPGVTVSGVVGYTYNIQASTDLSNTNSWTNVATLTLELPVQLWVDTTVNTTLPANPKRYYRVTPAP